MRRNRSPYRTLKSVYRLLAIKDSKIERVLEVLTVNFIDISTSDYPWRIIISIGSWGIARSKAYTLIINSARSIGLKGDGKCYFGGSIIKDTNT